MKSGGEQVGKAEVKRGKIFTVGELLRQVEAGYEEQETGQTGGWTRTASFVDVYSRRSELSDGKRYIVQVMGGLNSGYYLKLYGDEPEAFVLRLQNSNSDIFGKEKDLAKLCLLKEALDGALEAASLSARVYTRRYTSEWFGRDVDTELTAERCAEVRK